MNIKILIQSDLHLRKNTDLHQEIPNENLIKESQYFILAGDIGNFNKIKNYIDLINNINPNIQIIFVLGNHEYDGLIFENALQQYRDFFMQNFNNVKLLEKDYFIDNQNKIIFFGATLWSNYQLGKDKEKSLKLANDYFLEMYSNQNGEKKIMKADLSAKEFDKTIKQIKTNFNKLKNGYHNNQELKYTFDEYKKIMISHFLPLKEVLHPQFKHDLIDSAYFGSHIPNIVEMFDIWIYGHSHFNITIEQYKNKTVVLSNQRGFDKEMIKNHYDKNFNIVL